MVASEEKDKMNNNSIILALKTDLVLFPFTELAETVSRILVCWGAMEVRISDMNIFQLPSTDIKQNVGYISLAKFKMKFESGKNLDYTW